MLDHYKELPCPTRPGFSCPKKTTLFSRQYFECWDHTGIALSYLIRILSPSKKDDIIFAPKFWMLDHYKELPCPTWSGSSRLKKTTLFSRQNFACWITKELPCPTWSGSSRPPKKTTLFSRQKFECWITIRNCPVLPDLGPLVQKRRHYFRAKILNVG